MLYTMPLMLLKNQTAIKSDALSATEPPRKGISNQPTPPATTAMMMARPTPRAPAILPAASRPPHQPPRHPRPRDLRRRPAHLQLAVPLHQLLPPDQRGQEGLVGDIEEDGQDADEEGDGAEQGDGEGVKERGEGDSQEEDAPRA